MSTVVYPFDPRRHSLASQDLSGPRASVGFQLGRAKSGMMGERNSRRLHFPSLSARRNATGAQNGRSLFGGDGLRVNTSKKEREDVDVGMLSPASSKTQGQPVSPTTADSRIEDRASSLGLFYGVVSEVQRHNARMELLRYRCIVLPGSKFRRFWDLTSLVLLMYVAIFTPVQIAFFGDAMSIPRWREWLMIFLLDRVVDIVFTIDIVINFRTAW